MTTVKDSLQNNFKDQALPATPEADIPEIGEDEVAIPNALIHLCTFFEDMMINDYKISSGRAQPAFYSVPTEKEPYSQITIVLNMVDPFTDGKNRESESRTHFKKFKNDLALALHDMAMEQDGGSDPVLSTGSHINDSHFKNIRDEENHKARETGKSQIIGGISLDTAKLGAALTVGNMEDFVAILRKMQQRHMFWTQPLVQTSSRPVSKDARECFRYLLEDQREALYDMHANGPYVSKDAMLMDFVRSSTQQNQEGVLGHAYTLDDLDGFIAAHQRDYGLKLDPTVRTLYLN